MIASGVWSHAYSLDYAHSLKEVTEPKRTMKQELERIGYLGSTPTSFEAMPMAVSRSTQSQGLDGSVLTQALGPFRTSHRCVDGSFEVWPE